MRKWQGGEANLGMGCKILQGRLWRVSPFPRTVLMRLSVASLFGEQNEMLKKLFVLAICLTTLAWAATRPDFSGDYAAQQKKSDKPITASLRVIQTESAVTRIYGDKFVTNKFPLDGSEGDYTTETGVRGKCKAQLKNDALVLESLVASRPNTNTPSLRFDTIEEWRLSADTKTLTIKTQIKSPDMSPDVMAAVFPNNPRTEKYQRLDAR